MIRRSAAILTCFGAASVALIGCTITTYDNGRGGYSTPPANRTTYQSAPARPGAPPPPPVAAPRQTPAAPTNTLVGAPPPPSPAVAHPVVTRPAAPTVTPAPPGIVPAAPIQTAPGALPVVRGSTIFGSGTAATFRGLIFAVASNTTQLPNFASMRAVGEIFTDGFAVSPQDFRTGFPGVLAQSDFFGISYEGNITLLATARYTFQVDSDDGSVLSIDGAKVLTDDGTHPAELVTSAPVSLNAGLHHIKLDYFQAAGPVALSVFISTNGGAFSPLRPRQ